MFLNLHLLQLADESHRVTKSAVIIPEKQTIGKIFAPKTSIVLILAVFLSDGTVVLFQIDHLSGCSQEGFVLKRGRTPECGVLKKGLLKSLFHNQSSF